MAMAVTILGTIYVSVMFILCFFRRYRRFAVWTGVLAIVITLTAAAFAGHKLDVEAKEAGYKGAEDKRHAERAGITDPEIWDKQREKFLAEWAKEEKLKEAQEKETADASCKSDFNCWTNRFNRRAVKECTPSIEKTAKNSFEWTDSFTEPKFPRALIRDNGTITYAGDEIKMQNGFGAWIIMTYECDFDTASETALAVRVFPGQL